MTKNPEGGDDLARDVLAAVEAEARAAEEEGLRLAEAKMVWPAPLAAPAPPSPEALSAQMVDECFHLEHLGDGRLLQHLFRGFYLSHTLPGEDPKKRFRQIYRYVGSHWDLDGVLCYQVDFMWALGEAYKIRAGEFYQKAKEVEELLAAMKLNDDAPPNDIKEKESQVKAHKKTADAYIARGKRCLATPRMLHAAGVAFSGLDGLCLPSGVEWNDHPTWLPCLNGTIDLETSRLMESRPEHYFNRIAPWEFKGLFAPCPQWLETVQKILGYDEELINYVEYIVGAMATGFQTKDFIVALGPKADNGKSLFFETLARCLGEFAVGIEVDMLLKQTHRNSGAAHPEALRLRGARLAHTQEADSGDVFDVGKVKKYTSGGDAMAFRTLNSDFFHHFGQAFTLVIHTNKPPRLHEGDKGLARRLRIIPFRTQFVGADQPENPAKLIFHARDRHEMMKIFDSEMSGILGWITRCAGRFLKNGRRLPPPPPVVVAESADYMIEHDVVGQFVQAKCNKREGWTESGLFMYRAFKRWCEDEMDIDKKDIISATRFGRQIKEHFNSRRVNGHVEYQDVELIDRPDSPDEGAEARRSADDGTWWK